MYVGIYVLYSIGYMIRVTMVRVTLLLLTLSNEVRRNPRFYLFPKFYMILNQQR